MNLKIQILAGNTLMSRFYVGFEIELPLKLQMMLPKDKDNPKDEYEWLKN